MNLGKITLGGIDIMNNIDVYKIIKGLNNLRNMTEIVKKIEERKNKIIKLAEKNKDFEIIQEIKALDKKPLTTFENCIEEYTKLFDKYEKVYVGEKNYNKFQLTSKETDFQKYSKTIEIIDQKARTKPIIIENNTKNKKGIISKGEISCYLASPLDWLNKEYKLVEGDSINKTELIQKIKATNHFKLSQDEINIFNAIVYLIKMKQYEDEIFISFNEIHKQLGYTRLRPEHKIKYRRIIDKFSYTRIFIDLSMAKQRNYKKYLEINENIEEPLLIFISYKRRKVKFNNTVKMVDGFFTLKTKLIKFHFDYTKQFLTFEKPVKRKNKTKLLTDNQSKLNTFINKSYYLQKNNKDQTYNQYKLIDNILQDVLSEFDMHNQYLKACKDCHKSRFLKRHIFNVLENNIFVKSYEIKKINELEYLIVYWKTGKI